MLPPVLVMPLRLIIHKNLILGTFPLVRARDFVVLVELHRLVFLARIVRQIEVLLLEFEVSSSRHTCLGRKLRLSKLGLIRRVRVGLNRRQICLSRDVRLITSGGYWALPLLGVFAGGLVSSRSRRLLKALVVRTTARTGFIDFAGLLCRDLSRGRIAAALFLGLRILTIVDCWSCTCKQSQPETAR